MRATSARRSAASARLASALRRASSDWRLVALWMTGISARRLVELAADQHAADLAGAGADLVELGIAQQAARGEFIGVAVAAECLDRLERAGGGFLGRVQDATGRIEARGLPPVAGPRHGINVGTAGIECRVHVRDLGL